MSNGTDAEFVFGEDSRIERNLAPIGKRITAFETDAGRASAAIKSLETSLGRDTEAIGQTHFEFLGKDMIGRTMSKRVALVNFAKIKMPWRQHIRSCKRGKARARKSTGRAISAANIIPGDDHAFGDRRLAAARIRKGNKSENRACD